MMLTTGAWWGGLVLRRSGASVCERIRPNERQRPSRMPKRRTNVRFQERAPDIGYGRLARRRIRVQRALMLLKMMMMQIVVPDDYAWEQASRRRPGRGRCGSGVEGDTAGRRRA